ncbi:MAG: hypothetical protein HY658_09390 [Actinobacteria bacterium]|nr:hypothetical protein [Actinomycetota bacterium]
MSAPGRSLAVALGVLLALSGCAGRPGPARVSGSVEEAGGVSGSVEAGTLVCRPELRPPAGFGLVETASVEEAGRVGIRRSYRDPAGRELHATAGISGEFSEGSAEAGTIGLASGGEAVLFGQGSDWIAIWVLDDGCGTRTVAGTGMDRGAFLALVEEAGVAG